MALLLALGMTSTACGTTAYRDRIEIAASEGAQTGGGSVASPAPNGQTGATDTETGLATDLGSSDGAVVGSGSVGTGSGSISSGLSSSGSTSSGTTSSGTTSSGSGTTSGGTNSGTTDPGSTQPGQSASPAPSGGSTPAPGQSAQPTPEPTTAPPAGSARTEPDERGLTADTINVGFVKLGSFRALGDSLGFSTSATGDVDGQINSIVNFINANGGVAGREIRATIREYKQEEASPANENTICTALSQDSESWAVVLQGQIYQSTRVCYANEKVTTIDPSPFTFDDDLFAQLAPYYWNPSYPSYDVVAKNLVPELSAQKFWDPVATRGETAATEIKLGVLYFNYDSARRVLETDLEPALAAIGRKVDSRYEVNGSNAGTIQAGLSDAVTAFQTDNINRVVFIGGSPLAPFFFLNADNRGYAPRYGMTTIDAPRNTSEQQWKDQMLDAVGIGFNPVNDVFDDKHAFPSNNPTEKLCLDIMAAEGHTFEKRQNAQSGLAYCEALLLLDAAGDATGINLSHTTWAAAAEQLGGSYTAATSLGTAFEAGRHAGGSQFRTIAFDAATMTFSYTSQNQNFQ